MKSIRIKLTLFVSCLCILLIALVWVLTVGNFSNNYTTRLRKELNSQISTIAAVLDNAGSSNSSAFMLASACNDLVNPGVCVDISLQSSPASYFFVIEKVGDSCQLHSSGGITENHNVNTATAVQLRQQTLNSGSLNTILTDGKGDQQMVIGTLSSSGYIILASTNLERVDQALEVVNGQLILISVILLAVSILLALLFARWFTGPITRLSAAARQVAAGNYDVRVNIDSADEIGALAKDFNYMTGEVAKSNQLQRDLIANVSHDLRTPLTIIKGYAETVRDLDGEDRKRRNEDLSIIIDESDRLTVLVNSVLELSKYTSGTQKPSFSEFDLVELVEDVLRRYRDRAVKENFTISMEGPDEAEVRADPVQIGRVLHNLISNAIAHLDKDEKRVTVRISEKGSGFRVDVADNGCGISAQELPYVYDRYYRARSDAGKRGSGLGLSIVKAILVAHKTQFGVQSEQGSGSVFWFELPAPEERPALPEGAGGQDAPHSPDGRK